ncbi:hypothetical protein [Lysinibacillus sp. NPDC059133]|uniref:hypothetical protein n=1 Tax=Lysinibacillus sp. NPDC059133 TaxID=3346737 RepID=UPI0036A5C68F
MPLTLRFRAEQSFLGASDEPLLLLSLRFRTENIRYAAGSRANTMLVTKALSQDVMLLAFVPLLLIPKESPSLHSNQLIYGVRFNFFSAGVQNILIPEYCDKTFFNTKCFLCVSEATATKCFLCVREVAATNDLMQFSNFDAKIHH